MMARFAKYKRRRGGVSSRPAHVYTGRGGWNHPIVEAIESGTGPKVAIVRRRSLRAGAEEVRQGLAS